MHYYLQLIVFERRKRDLYLWNNVWHKVINIYFVLLFVDDKRKRRVKWYPITFYIKNDCKTFTALQSQYPAIKSRKYARELIIKHSHNVLFMIHFIAKLFISAILICHSNVKTTKKKTDNYSFLFHWYSSSPRKQVPNKNSNAYFYWLSACGGLKPQRRFPYQISIFLLY